MNQVRPLLSHKPSQREADLDRRLGLQRRFSSSREGIGERSPSLSQTLLSKLRKASRGRLGNPVRVAETQLIRLGEIVNKNKELTV